MVALWGHNRFFYLSLLLPICPFDLVLSSEQLQFYDQTFCLSKPVFLYFHIVYFQDGEFLTLPTTASLDMLTVIKNQLGQERDVVQRSSRSIQANSQQAGSGSTGTSGATGTSQAGGSENRPTVAQQNNLHQIQVSSYLIGLDKRKMFNVKLSIFSYLSILTHIFCAQKNPLIEAVLLSTYNMCFGWEIKKNNF